MGTVTAAMTVKWLWWLCVVCVMHVSIAPHTQGNKTAQFFVVGDSGAFKYASQKG